MIEFLPVDGRHALFHLSAGETGGARECGLVRPANGGEESRLAQ
jgi:hypothetical protein